MEKLWLGSSCLVGCRYHRYVFRIICSISTCTITSAGSLFSDETTSWNVANLKSALSRLLPISENMPGVNTPYLYFGMWRAEFAWHVEDMDLFSINYIHFGAPKFWYAVPQAKAVQLENSMRNKSKSRPINFNLLLWPLFHV